jgi:POT family proton-dependent oligopeptide transporter
VAPQPAGRDLFGHPRGLAVLAGTEMWERFSFFGMQALLMLYMTKYLLLPEHERNVLGLGAFRDGLSAVFGPLTDLAFAAQIYGIYSGLVFGMPLFGAWLGDRRLGKTWTVALGCVLMSAGHLAMASEHFFLVALAMIVTGAGGVVGNMAAQVGLLYAPDDTRRTRAFGVYLITLNIGALTAPLIVGTLGEKIGWQYGFGAAGVGMLLGLVFYLTGLRYLPSDRTGRREARARLTVTERRRVWAVLLVLVPYMLNCVPSFQAYGIMYVWADTAVDRRMFGWEMPVTWIGIADGVLTILGVVAATRLWAWQAARGCEPHDMIKMAIGYAMMTTAWFVAAAIALLHSVPVLLWVLFFLIMDFSFAWTEAPTQSLITRDAPVSVTATLMAVFKATTMVGFFGIGWMGRFYEPFGPSLFWAFTGTLSAAACALLLVLRPRLLAMLEPERET